MYFSHLFFLITHPVLQSVEIISKYNLTILNVTRDNDFHLMGRRRFIKTLSSMGLSTGAIATLSQEGLAELTDDPTERVPILVGHRHTYPNGYDSAPEIKPVHKTIAYDRWAKIEAAYDAAERIKNKLRSDLDVEYTSESGVRGGINKPQPIGVGVKYDSSSKNNTSLIVSVGYKTYIKRGRNKKRKWEPNIPFKEVEKRVPSKTMGIFADNKYEEKFENIPVEVNETEIEEENSFDSKYRPLVGGCEIGDASSTAYATSCFSMWHRDRERRMMTTSGHAIDGWTDAEQPSGGNKVSGAQVWIDDDWFDAGWFEVTVDQYPSVANGDGGYIDDTLGGTRGIDWLKTEGTYTEFVKQGSKTGRTTGTVEEIKDETEHAFDSSCKSDNGDSGGIYYERSNDKYWIIGIHNWAGGMGNGIERVEERLNLLV